MSFSLVSRRQRGASLIEVLISVLILSFGMLALGAMLSSSVMMPKLSGYRSSATALASSHIERMRANPGSSTIPSAGGFNNGDYDKMSYDGTLSDIALADCSYPTCTASSLASMDNAASQRATRIALPAGGLIVRRDAATGSASLTLGNIWVVWQEPSTNADLNPSSSDNCPIEITSVYTDPKPRCLYVRFKL